MNQRKSKDIVHVDIQIAYFIVLFYEGIPFVYRRLFKKAQEGCRQTTTGKIPDNPAPRPVLVTCGGVDCLFEFIMYVFVEDSEPTTPISQLQGSPRQLSQSSVIRQSLSPATDTTSDGPNGQLPNNTSLPSPGEKDNRAREQRITKRALSAFNPLSSMGSPPELGGEGDFSQDIFSRISAFNNEDGGSTPGHSPPGRSTSSAPPGTR